MTTYIGYYRVSTSEQGISGLGIEAQRAAVLRYAGDGLAAGYTDIESGKNDNRPQLLAALAHCKTIGATLLIAKLDRLSRNLTFISSLMDSHVKFKCCDMPEANEMTIHIMAAMAQAERKAIGERTRASLQALKDRGVVLGNPGNFTQQGRNKGAQARKDNAALNRANNQASVLIKLLREQGTTLKAIADKLNANGFKTPKGCEFTPTQVARLA